MYLAPFATASLTILLYALSGTVANEHEALVLHRPGLRVRVDDGFAPRLRVRLASGGGRGGRPRGCGRGDDERHGYADQDHRPAQGAWWDCESCSFASRLLSFSRRARMKSRRLYPAATSAAPASATNPPARCVAPSLSPSTSHASTSVTIGYRLPSTAAMPTAPKVVAAAKSTFGAGVEDADTDDQREDRARWLEGRRRHEGGDDDDRNRGEARRRHCPRCASRRRRHRCRRRTGRSRGPRRRRARLRRRRDAVRSARGSRERTTMPATTSATPSHCRVEGTSPRAASTPSGTTGDAAEIGATIPIAPMAKPR